MRELIRQFVTVVANTLPIQEPIYEFGACQVPGQEVLANLRPIFRGKLYVGCDIQAGPGVDRVLNLHNIALPEATAGTILILDTLEHVEYPHLAMREAFRILKTGGVCIISSVLGFPIHNPPDYWRFTPEGFTSLLKPFSWGLVSFKGDPNFPHTIVGVGGKGDKPNVDNFINILKKWKA